MSDDPAAETSGARVHGGGVTSGARSGQAALGVGKAWRSGRMLRSGSWTYLEHPHTFPAPSTQHPAPSIIKSDFFSLVLDEVLNFDAVILMRIRISV